MVPVMVDGAPVVSQAALRLRDELATHLACLPAVPGVLDAVLETWGTEQVAEITGRSRLVIRRDGRRVVERRSASAAKAETDAFMSGKKRVLVFSDAGGTGRSYHADLGAAARSAGFTIWWSRAGGRTRRSRPWAARTGPTRPSRRCFGR